MSDTWCSLAWNHHFVGPGGNCKPCCRFKIGQIPKSHNLSKNSLEEIYDDDFMRELREKMLRGERIYGCKKCYEEEEAGKRASLRQIFNNIQSLFSLVDIKKPKIVFMESAFSNLCDLQCVMCQPYLSSAWSSQDISEISDLISPYPKMTLDSIEPLKTVIPGTVLLKFTGGEPLLIKEYWKIIEERSKHPGFEDCFFNYSSNLMHFPSEDLIDLWKKVKFVELATSFDGVGKVIEYVRYPSKWKVVEKNLIKYMELSREFDMRVGMRATIMIYNVMNLPEMTEWWVENINEHYRESFTEDSWYNPSHVAVPEYLSLRVLPRKCKEIVRDRLWNKGMNKKVNKSFNHLCNYMMSEDHSHLLSMFKRYTRVMDRRGITFQEICPELYEEIFKGE